MTRDDQTAIGPDSTPEEIVAAILATFGSVQFTPAQQGIYDQVSSGVRDTLAGFGITHMNRDTILGALGATAAVNALIVRGVEPSIAVGITVRYLSDANAAL